MKKYIIFCYNITGMGGGQQFVYTKAQYLIHNGFDVSVYSTIEGNIIIPGLQLYKNLIVRELKYPPCSFRKSEVKKLVRLIAASCSGKYDEILIESDGGYETQWAELIAEHLNAQHIVFSVAEQQSKCYSHYFHEFLYYKYERKELYGINHESIKLLFKGYKNITDSKDYSFTAPCNNVVDEYGATPEYVLPLADINIAGIWRTNKTGFVECMESIIPFVQEHSEKKFNIVVIGGGSLENEKKVKNLFFKVPNATVIFTGFMYPIPKSLFLKMDVFVSTAGSSRIPVRYGIPSITVTSGLSTEGKVILYTIGILNYTTKNTVVPEESGFSTSDLLEKILFQNYCNENPTLGMEKEFFDEEMELKEELERFGHIKKQYYDIFRIRPILRMEKAYAIIGKIFGTNTLFGVDKIGHNLKSRVRSFICL